MTPNQRPSHKRFSTGICATLGLLLATGACTTTPAATTPTREARCAGFALKSATASEETIVLQGSLDTLGPDGYPVFRIPALVTTASGVLLAFSEARQSMNDPGAGQIALVQKRSLDCGRTWSKVQVVAENGGGDAHNPTAVVAPRDDGTSRVWLFYSQRPKSAGGEFDIAVGTGSDSDTIWSRTSDDDGVTWTAPKEITAGVKDATWGIAAMGPGRAIVTRWGTASAPTGRIVVPGWYTKDGKTGSFAFFSDDNGATWKRGAVPEMGTDESQVVELSDGSLVLDARQSGNTATRRLFHSADGGQTWSAPTDGLGMVPIMSSIIRLSAKRDGDAGDWLLHTGVSTSGRSDARAWLSGDEGKTWTHETVFAPGFAQYSVATRLDDGSIGVVYESMGEDGTGLNGFNVHFVRFGLGFLGATGK